MAGTITTTNTFASQTGPIPLSQLDANFTNVNTSINNLNIYSNYYADSSLSANTITVTTTGSQTVTYAAGLTLAIKVNNTNTGATTINVNSLGAKSLVTGTSTALNAGAITSGQIVVAVYDGTNFQLQGVFSGEGNFASIDVSGAANLNGTVTLGAGTANGVAYLNGSKVLTTGSALTFDGTTLLSYSFTTANGVNGAYKLGYNSSTSSRSWKIVNDVNVYGDFNILQSTTQAGTTYQGVYSALNDGTQFWLVGGSEQMRLTSTGLGIGTSSPSQKLTVAGKILSLSSSGTDSFINVATNGVQNTYLGFNNSGSTNTNGVLNNYSYVGNGNAYGLQLLTNGGVAATIDTSGNLGLGVTPSAWENSAYQVKAIQVGQGGAIYGFNASSHTNDMVVNSNAYVTTSGASKYINSGYALSYQMTSGQYQWLIAGSGSAGGTVSFTQAMTLDNSGNLGLGVTNPSSYVAGSSYTAFALNGSNGSNIALNGGGTNIGLIYAATGNSNLYVANYTSSGNLIFSTNTATERARIDSSGNLMVGTTTVSDSSGVGIKLQSSATAPEIAVVVSASTGGSYGYSLYSTGAGAYRFYADNAGTIHATSTSITAISDQTLKTNVKPLETGLTQIMALQPRRFDWINGDATNVAGFIAQEVEQVLPDLVAPFKYTDTETKLGLKMGDMIPTLVKAIQELKAELDTLKAKVGN